MKALILDFGGVVSRTLFETHDLTESALGLESGSLRWRGPFEPMATRFGNPCNLTKFSERDYWDIRTQEVAASIGANWTEMSDFVKAARGAAPAEIIRPEFLTTIETAGKAGIRLAILSNELDLFYGSDFRSKLPFLEKFDVIHDATYTKILKPDARAYQACLKDLNLQASQCVFVDDQARNIKGAQRVGLPTVHFDVQNPARSYGEALQLLGV